VLHSKRRERVEGHFARHGNLTVFAGRFAPGGRSLVFVFAGMSKMSYFRFLLIDGMAAMISVPLFIWLGHHFAQQISDNFIAYLDRQKKIVIPIMLCVLAAGILIYIVRRRRAHASSLENV
jgi:membrane protein DedA with SNARE-associated domain